MSQLLTSTDCLLYSKRIVSNSIIKIKKMDNDYYFKKLCWVCLAEKSDMDSIITNNEKIQVDNVNSHVSLYDLLSYVIADKICFMDGPHSICSSCKMQAYTAYKFKKRCELSHKVFQRSGLILCEKEIYSKKLENLLLEQNSQTVVPDEQIVKEEVMLFDDTFIIKEDIEEILDSVEFEDEAVVEIVDKEVAEEEEKAKPIFMADPKAEKRRLPTPQRKTFLCSICGLQKSRQGIRQHMLRHSNARIYTCQFCERKFNDKGNLNVHVRIHTGVYPYTCNICNKKFIQATGLKTHKRVHDNVKPYKCHICPYSTRTSSHLQLHIKRHMGLKNYHCDQCDYSACSKAELKYHFAKHTNDKTFVCNICNKGFTRYKGLKTHEKSHTGEKPHICELCGRGFTQAHSLRSHLRNIHKQEK